MPIRLTTICYITINLLLMDFTWYVIDFNFLKKFITNK
jgi:hypothetical protein